MGEEPALRNVYAPGFHVLGALLSAWVGPAAAVKLLALAGAAALIAGFRCFQRAAGLPEAAAALFAWAPYGFALSWCLPKLEAAGYGLAFAGLGLILLRRERGVALALAATFFVHTGAALFFGLCGGVLALATRSRRGLVALGVGCLLASPLLAAHLAAGCTPAEALLLSRGDYLRAASGWSSLAVADRVVALAGPIAVVCGALGAGRLWREHRAVAILAALALVLYTNELWLAPFGGLRVPGLLRGGRVPLRAPPAGDGRDPGLRPVGRGLRLAGAARLLSPRPREPRRPRRAGRRPLHLPLEGHGTPLTPAPRRTHSGCPASMAERRASTSARISGVRGPPSASARSRTRSACSCSRRAMWA
jgi:hypothetical protein